MDVDEHLFRREAGRLVSALTRIFGVHNLALAEDVVQDAFCRALEVWRVRGAPDNPSAWLMTTARIGIIIGTTDTARTATAADFVIYLPERKYDRSNFGGVKGCQTCSCYSCCRDDYRCRIDLRTILTHQSTRSLRYLI